ncbi:MAG TPA: hypothetical protein QF525_05340, partial [Candidatus Thalassarchaeaceae archaeon]|nr:hypothetical protein [Candidatus Thalassarchaeaceae archaeon]
TLNPVTVNSSPFGLIVFVVFHEAMPALANGAIIISITRAVASLRRLAVIPCTLLVEIIAFAVAVLRTVGMTQNAENKKCK